MTDLEWHRLVKAGADEGWRLVWERVIAPEAKSLRSADLMKKYSLTDGDLEVVGTGPVGRPRNDKRSFVETGAEGGWWLLDLSPRRLACARTVRSPTIQRRASETDDTARIQRAVDAQPSGVLSNRLTMPSPRQLPPLCSPFGSRPEDARFSW